MNMVPMFVFRRVRHVPFPRISAERKNLETPGRVCTVSVPFPHLGKSDSGLRFRRFPRSSVGLKLFSVDIMLLEAA